MNNAIWFSRHAPSGDQLAEIAALGYTLVERETTMELASRSISDQDDRTAVAALLKAAMSNSGARALFGVIPVPLRFMAAGEEYYLKAMPVFESWNVMRSVEGQKPTFAHREFLRVGDFIY